MTIPYGRDKEVFSSSLFVVLCNRLTSCLLAAVILLVWQPFDPHLTRSSCSLLADQRQLPARSKVRA